MDTITLIEKIIALSIPTGSRTMGVHKENSDYDYVVPYKVYEQLILPNTPLFRFYETQESDAELYDSDIDDFCCYIFRDSKHYNFIIRESYHQEYAWIKTAKIMPYFPRLFLRDRKRRLHLFHCLLNIFRFISGLKNDPTTKS